MAPRRGGSGGHGISIGSVNNRCSEADAFSQGYAVGYEVVYAIFLFAGFVLSWMWWTKKRRVPQVKSLLPGKTFGIALLTYCISYISVIIQFTLMECDVEFYYEFDKYSTITSWFSQLSQLILAAIVIFKFIPHLYRAIGMKTMIPLAVNGFIYGLLVILTIVWLSLYTALAVMEANHFYYFDEGLPSIYWPEKRTIEASAFFSFFLSISVAVFFVLVFLKMKKRGPVSNHFKIGVFFFITAYFIDGLISIVNVIYYTIENNTSSPAGYVVDEAFSDLFQFLPYLALLYVATSPEMGLTNTTEEAAYDAVASKPNDMSSESTAYHPVAGPGAAYPPPQNGFYANGNQPHVIPTPPMAQHNHQVPQQQYAHYSPPPQQQHVQPQNQWGGYNPVPAHTGDERW